MDADRGVQLDLPEDPVAIEALIAANRARIAELKTRPYGGVNSMSDVSGPALWLLGELAAVTAWTVAMAWLVRAGALPIAALGLCLCMVVKVAMLVITGGLAVGRACLQVARWALGEQRTAPPAPAPVAPRCEARRRAPLVRRVDLHAHGRMRARARGGEVVGAMAELAVPRLRRREAAHVLPHDLLYRRARGLAPPCLDDHLVAHAVDPRSQAAVLGGGGVTGGGDGEAERGGGEERAGDHGAEGTGARKRRQSVADPDIIWPARPGERARLADRA